MTDAQRVLVLREAVYNMGKLLREHPIETDWYLEEPQRLAILAGGTARDPEGKEWANYFVFKAHEKLTEEGVLRDDETVG